nr:AraC family transcriptional regulator [Shewanella submarina]
MFVLLVFDSRVNRGSRILGGLCLGLAISFLLPFIVQERHIFGVGWLIGPVFYLPACYGALSYLYIRTTVSSMPLSLADSVHFLPLLACYLINFDTLFDGNQMLALVSPGGSAEPLIWKYRLSQLIVFSQAFFYSALTLRFLLRYRRQASEQLASFNPNIFNWLITLMGFNFAIWSLKAVLNYGSGSQLLVLLADLIIVALIYFIGFAQWRNPSLFSVVESKPTEEPGRTPPDEVDKTGPSAMDSDTGRALIAEIREQMQSKQLYLDSGLTLAALASHIGASPHLVSEALNRHEGQNFHTFINGYRVDKVCASLKLHPEDNILNLALDAGFSSKSAFNAIFKKMTGVTPSQYRRALNSPDL